MLVFALAKVKKKFLVCVWKNNRNSDILSYLIISYFDENNIKQGKNVTVHLILVFYRCGIVIFLAQLAMHIQNNCSKKIEGSKF